MPAPMGPNRKILFQCPEELAQKLDAFRGDTPVAVVIREALIAHIEKAASV